MRSNFAEVQYEAIPFDFRQTTWGMSRSEVKLAESKYPLTENETHVTYIDQFIELEATVGFHFIDDSLIEAGYSFHEVCLDLESCIRNYDKIKLELLYNYGLPTMDKQIRISPENDSCFMHPSPTADKNIFIAEWRTLRSMIRLLLVSDKLATEFGILYISREREINFSASVN